MLIAFYILFIIDLGYMPQAFKNKAGLKLGLSFLSSTLRLSAKQRRVGATVLCAAAVDLIVFAIIW